MPETVPLWKANEENPVIQVRKVLTRFQEFYMKRRIDMIHDFLMELFIQDDRLLVIGTGPHAWRKGLEEVRQMVEWDWVYWGDLELDIPNASIQVNGNVSWVAMEGKLSKANQSRILQKHVLAEIKSALDEDEDPERKLQEISRKTSEVLAETARGDDFIWPLRFTAILENQDEQWLFSQIQYAFPTSRLPDERLFS